MILNRENRARSVQGSSPLLKDSSSLGRESPFKSILKDKNEGARSSIKKVDVFVKDTDSEY